MVSLFRDPGSGVSMPSGGRGLRMMDEQRKKLITSLQKSYHVFCGAEALANTDHFLTVAKFAVQRQYYYMTVCINTFINKSIAYT